MHQRRHLCVAGGAELCGGAHEDHAGVWWADVGWVGAWGGWSTGHSRRGQSACKHPARPSYTLKLPNCAPQPALSNPTPQPPQRNPMGSPDDLSYLQVRCAKQGEALWHQFTVREVFGEEGVSAAGPGPAEPGWRGRERRNAVHWRLL